jgi:hypothetical protein
MGLYLLDYGAGNVQSLANSLKQLGHEFTWISSPEDFSKATVSYQILIDPNIISPIRGNFRRASYSLVLVHLNPRSRAWVLVVSSNLFVNIFNPTNHILVYVSDYRCSSNHQRSRSLPVVLGLYHVL